MAALLLAPVALLLLGFLLFAFTLPGPAPAGVRTDGVVVLTGGSGRLARGAEVLKAGLASRMLVSGVDRTVRPEELRRALGLPRPLFEERVELGFVAEDTRSNAAEVAEWVTRHELRSIRIVTSDYHARRARAEIAARVPAEVGLVVDAVPGHARPASLFREYLKFLATRLLRALG
ncbi:YdcF family protein [Thermaurantiacus sp.]